MHGLVAIGTSQEYAVTKPVRQNQSEKFSIAECMDCNDREQKLKQGYQLHN